MSSERKLNSRVLILGGCWPVCGWDKTYQGDVAEKFLDENGDDVMPRDNRVDGDRDPLEELTRIDRIIDYWSSKSAP